MNFVFVPCALLILQNLCVRFKMAGSLSLASVHWNSSNPIFKPSKNSHLIEVSLYDDIDFICPYYESEQKEYHIEYYIVYQVKEKNYRTCQIEDDDMPIMILNCSNPFLKKRFTLLFESFVAIPNVPEFIAGGRYYFITTSTGQYDGLRNTHWGACHFNHMRLIVSVCCQSTTLSAHQRKKNQYKNLVTGMVPKHDLLSSLTAGIPKNASSHHRLLIALLFCINLLLYR